ncbi:MAG: molybdopterin-dependent oxidoreductase [Enterocloster asparagiformis]|nr:molybdopterin-dependent oxidoreductase [Enterocloster asparagiformis]
MMELNQRIKAKIPGPETGIEIRRTLCDICTPQMHCGLDVYVKDGVVLKVEGSPDHPVNRGFLCTKGAGNRQYLYRKDRLLTPLRRVGPRGEGTFEPISWEEAIRTVCGRLTGLKEAYGADSVAFFSGYGKWYRPMYRRFAHVFGTQNYGTESSCCFTSGLMAWQVATGMHVSADMAHSGLFLGWGANGYYSRYRMPDAIEQQKKRGMKVIIVDPRITPASQRLADLHLRPRLGTDGALALSIAHVLIRSNWVDSAYIDRYVCGYEAYRRYVDGFPPEAGERLTGVPASQIVQAARMIHENGPMSICESSAPIGHHRNGLQNYRAIMSLLAITGNYDREGGQIPAVHTYMELSCGFETGEEEFMNGRFPREGKKAVGADRFPLWYELRREMQSNDLPNRILARGGERIRAVFALGMNLRMFPGDNRIVQALKELDFFVDTDLFLTDTARYADIVLPACTSLERGEFKCYPGGYAWYTKPVVSPLGQAKSDADILTLMAREMDLDDELLKEGYRACIRHMIHRLPVTVEELEASPTPVALPGLTPYRPGTMIEQGLPTPSGRFELDSLLISRHPEWGLDSLPTYTAPANPAPDAWPMRLCAGARIPGALHSRLHDQPWERSLCPRPQAEISLEDAAALGVETGDELEVSTPFGSIRLEAAPTGTVSPGEVFLYHGYREADANSILDPDNLDPYSGFPAFRSAYCKIRRCAAHEN